MTQIFKKLISSIRMDVVETHGFMLSSVNYEIVMLYWRMGRKITTEELAGEFNREVFINRLREELKEEPLYNKLSFGFKDVDAMLVFARDYPDEGFVEEVFPKLSWELISVLMLETDQKVKRHWYAMRAIRNQWTVEDLRTSLAEFEYETRQLESSSEVDIGLVG